MADDSAEDLDLLQGTLDVPVRKLLSLGPRHGYAIARWVHDGSDETTWARYSAAVSKVLPVR